MQRYNIPSNSAIKCPKILKKIGLYKMFAIRLLFSLRVKILITTSYCSLRLILENQQEVGTLRYQIKIQMIYISYISD